MFLPNFEYITKASFLPLSHSYIVFGALLFVFLCVCFQFRVYIVIEKRTHYCDDGYHRQLAMYSFRATQKKITQDCLTQKVF